MLPDTLEDLDTALAIAKAGYSSTWKDMVDEWRVKTDDSAWLTYAANYLFVTAGVRWALDPSSLATQVKGIDRPNFAQDLDQLDLVVLSHAHNDHLDLKLIRDLTHLPITWIIPNHMLDQVLTRTSIRRDQIIVPVNGTAIQFRNLTLTPFDSLHFHDLGGIPETGYLVEFSNKRWLFPGDIRRFDTTAIPDFGRLDGVFAHLWLGKAKALDATPSQLDEFCAFFGHFLTERLVVSHLYEFRREACELWSQRHFELVRQVMSQLNPNIHPEKAIMGMSVSL